MYLLPYSYDGISLNSTNYSSIIPEDAPVSIKASAIENRRTNAFAQFASLEYDGINLPLVITIHGGTLDYIKQIFNPKTHTLPVTKKLIVTDENSKQWGIQVVPLYFTQTSQKKAIVILRASQPVLTSEIETSSTWNITASGDTKTLTLPVSNYMALPKFEITPTGTSPNYAVNVPILVRNQSSKRVNKYPLNVVSGWDTAALVTGGILQSDCKDVRVMVNGVEVDKWLFNPNTTYTRIWINISLSPKNELEQGSATINNSTPITTIQLKTGQDAKLKLLPKSGRVKIDSEIFTYTGINIKNSQLTGVTRAQWNSAMQTHTGGSTVYWIEHDIRLLYGSPSGVAQIVNDANKPVIDMTTSTNTQWNFADFADQNNLQSGSWVHSVKSKNAVSSFYTVAENASDDVWPAAVMGIELSTFTNSNGKTIGDVATVSWEFFNPFGIYSFSGNGKKYRVGAAWPAASVQKSQDGNKYTNLFSIVTPASASTLTDITITETLTGSALVNRLKVVQTGSVSGAVGAIARVEMRDAVVKLVTANVPAVALQPDNVNVQLDITLTNTSSPDSDAIKINYPCMVTETLIVDTENKVITYQGKPADSALAPYPVRGEWLPLLPSNTVTNSPNILQITSDFIGTMTIVVKYRERKIW